MQTSRNPKVLNHALRYKTRSVLDLVAKLESQQSENDEFISEKRAEATSYMDDVDANREEYEDKRSALITQISKANSDLSNLIKNNLYNPNTSTSESEEETGGDETEETRLISDKILKAAQFGFVVDGKDIGIYSVSGKGIVVGEKPVTDKEFIFLNPSNNEIPFPAYYVNDILFISPTQAMMATSVGVVIYDLSSASYKIRSTDYGLPSKEVVGVIKISTTDGDRSGYLAATKKGIAYSPTGDNWSVIDSTFKEECTCVSNIGQINTAQSLVFIGTGSGLYYFDVDKYFSEEYKFVSKVSNLDDKLPASYINCVSYNAKKDILVCGGIGGLTVLRNAKANYAKEDAEDISSDHVKVYSSSNGMTGTSVYSTLWTSEETKLIIGTSNGLSITTNFTSFSQITRITNSEDTSSSQRLTSHVCNKIVRESSGLYTILHGVGLSESIAISN